MTMFRRAALLSLLASLLLSHVQGAAAQDSETVLPEAAAQRELRRLSLQEALQLAVQNNLGIRLQRELVRSSEANVAESEAAYEPELSGHVDYNDSLSPPATTLEGMSGEVFSTVSQRWSLSLAQRIRWGTRLSLDANSSRFRSSSGSAVAPLVYGANLSLSASQPLLRGFSLDAEIPRQTILRAKVADERSRAAYRLQIAQEIKRTEDAYWNLVEALQSYGVQRSSLQLAQEQLAITERQITAGVLAPADLIGSESAVAERELAVLGSETRLEEAMDGLRQTLNLPSKEWRSYLIPEDLPIVEDRDMDEEEAMSRALQFREEIKQLDLDAELAALDSRVADNDRLPELDLGLRYGLVGQGDAYRDSLSQVGGLGARDWNVSLNLRWSPLGGAAEARSKRARAGARRSALLRERFLLDLRGEIRSALRELLSAQRRVVASERFLELAKRSLEAEQKRFLSGKSRNFEVSRREDALAQARTEALRAAIGFQRASSALDLATGQLLERKSIALDGP